jgi:hypothetical protein
MAKILNKSRRTNPIFQPAAFLAKSGLGRTIAEMKKGQNVFSQGDAASAVFYVQKGKIKLTVISKRGKEATIALLGEGNFLGEECITGLQMQRLASATTLIASTLLRIERSEMIRVLHEEQLFSEVFVSFAAGSIWQEWQSGNGDSQNEPGNTGGDDRHNPLPGKLLHESLPQTGVHRIQRQIEHSQFPAERRPPRLSLSGGPALVGGAFQRLQSIRKIARSCARSYSSSQQHFQKNSDTKDISSDAHDFLFHNRMSISHGMKSGTYSPELVNLVLQGFRGHVSGFPCGPAKHFRRLPRFKAFEGSRRCEPPY